MRERSTLHLQARRGAEAARGRDPDTALPSTTESVDDIAGEAVSCPPRRDTFAIDYAHAVLGGHPEAAGVQRQRAHVGARQPLRRRDDVEPIGAPPRDAGPTQPDPHGAIGVLEERARVIVRKGSGDRREPHTVEARNSGPRRDPEITIARLDDAGKGVVRQAFFNTPTLDEVAERHARRSHAAVGNEKQAQCPRARPDDGAVVACADGCVRQKRSSVTCACLTCTCLTCPCNYMSSTLLID